MKNQKMRSLLSLLLAAVMCTGTACSETSETSDETTAAVGAEETAVQKEQEETEITRENTPDGLPELDFDGATVMVSARDGSLDVYVEEDDGDAMNSAIFNRNLEVAERLNVDLQFNVYTDGSVTNDVLKTVTAGDDAYSIISSDEKSIIGSAFNGMFLNMKDTAYLDFSQPWWYDGVTNAMNFDENKIYLAQGEFRSVTATGTVFFNKDIYENLYEDNLYDTVRAGEWTMDAMTRMSADACIDFSGDGTLTAGEDQLGMMCWNTAFYYFFALSQGEEWWTYDADNHPVINTFSDHTTTMFDGIYNLFEVNGGANVALNDQVATIFSEGSVLFFPGLLTYFSLLRESEVDIGVIPYPKMDENQGEYQSFINGDVMVTGIPVTCQNTDLASATLEALAAGAYRTITMTEIDQVFKGQLSRDPETEEMIDLILASSTSEMLVMQGMSSNSWYSAIQEMCEKGGGGLSSIYASGMRRWQTFLDANYKKAMKNQ